MHPMESERHDHQLVEAVVSPSSRAVGRTISEFPLPDSPYKLTIVAVSRDGRPVEGRIEDVRVEAGDVAVLEVDDSFFYVNRGETELSLVRRFQATGSGAGTGRRWHR